MHVGAGVTATAVRGSNVQTRSAPSSFGGDFSQAGFEFVEGLDLAGRAPEVGREAAALLDAPVCPTGATTLVLGSAQLALQVHESVGHAVELDRIFGSEAGFAGTSWVAPEKIGVLRYGSDLMNVVADAPSPEGSARSGGTTRGSLPSGRPSCAGGPLSERSPRGSRPPSSGSGARAARRGPRGATAPRSSE